MGKPRGHCEKGKGGSTYDCGDGLQVAIYVGSQSEPNAGHIYHGVTACG